MTLSSSSSSSTGTRSRTTTLAVVATTVAVTALGTSLFWWMLEQRRKALTSSSSSSGEESTKKQQHDDDDCYNNCSAYESLIGDTPLIRLHHLSELIGRNGVSIYVKMESCNPGGTGKDRAALGMIRAAEAAGKLPLTNTTRIKESSSQKSIPKKKKKNVSTATTPPPTAMTRQKDDTPPPPAVADTTSLAFMDQVIEKAMQQHSTTAGGLVIEGTSGSTGISLAALCRARGHACLVVLPDDQAQEKQQLLKTLGATVHVVPTAAISNPQHYVSIARRLAQRAAVSSSVHHHNNNIQAVFMDQFENPANAAVHYNETGPEMYRQLLQQQERQRRQQHGRSNKADDVVSAFCMSAGTGGTIAGIGRYLKEQTRGQCRVVLVDPPGSVLYHKIEHGVAYTTQQAERRLKRHRYDTIAEGIGLDRVTKNVAAALPYIDQAISVTDQEAVDMAHWLLRHEGLFCGSSSSMNVVGAVRTARQLVAEQRSKSKNNITEDEGDEIVVLTIICDGGQRHVTRFWNRDFIRKWGLTWPGDDEVERIPECLRGIAP